MSRVRPAATVHRRHEIILHLMPQSHRARYGVVGLLISLFALTYLDRVCISVAGPRIQADLHIDPIGWGWVTGMFTLSYCLFEIPTGALGDRIGPRRVLTRIVLWWSAFTALTGAVTGYYPLLFTRFFFGAGEAGAFPSSAAVISRWFPSSRRATMSGVTLMAGQIGGALAPLLIVPIQSRYGWRASFFVFGALGLVWAAVWSTWFRDTPAGNGHARNLQPTAALRSRESPFPWRAALRSPSVLAVLGTAFCYVYAYNFFQTWFHTFLVKGRGFSEGGLLLSALPYVVAVCANLSGGAVSDALVQRLGLTRGRRALGTTALACAGLLTIGAMMARQQGLTVLLLSLVYGAITFQQSVVFGVCLDIGKKHAGVMTGLMNTSAQAGGLLGSVLYGYIVERFGSYDAPFVPMAGLLFLGALLWLKIDASTELIAVPRVEPVPLPV
jgi:MFS family permease